MKHERQMNRPTSQSWDTAGGELGTRAYALVFGCYHDGAYSLGKLGPYAFTHDYNFSAYLVGIHEVASGEKGTDMFHYCGEPAGMDWRHLDGALLVSYDVRFGKAVFTRLQELGVIPAELDVCWADLADLAAYLGAPRTWCGAARQLLGETDVVPVSEFMHGISWKRVKKDGTSDIAMEACIREVELYAKLWRDCKDKWPAHERKLSDLNRKMAEEGICVDADRLEKARAALNERMTSARDLIPWRLTDEIGSAAAYNWQCGIEGVTAPPTLDTSSLEYIRWEKEAKVQHPWMDAVEVYQGCEPLLHKLTILQNRIRPDGMAETNFLVYCGASTGRFTGGGGLNMQNLSKGERYGVREREFFIPRPGHVFVISDLAQIEPRVLLVLAEDVLQRHDIARGANVYEAHARTTMGWRGKDGHLKVENPKLYALAKARVLGLGYGCGPDRFRDLAKQLAGLDLSKNEAAKQVETFRRANSKITDMWRKWDLRIRLAERHALKVPLPSGRMLMYRDVHKAVDGWHCTVRDEDVAIYGAKIVENMVQATARDIFCGHLLAIADAGYTIRLHVHDEVIVEVPEAEAEQAAAEIKGIMSTAPCWMRNIPLAAETIITNTYSITNNNASNINNQTK